MVKTVIKLAIALAILNAAFRASVAAWDYYQLRDEAQQLIVFGGNVPTIELHNRIIQRAGELDIPLLADDLTVRREGQQTFVSGRYTQPVEWFPNQFYSVDLSFSLDTIAINALPQGQAPR